MRHDDVGVDDLVGVGLSVGRGDGAGRAREADAVWFDPERWIPPPDLSGTLTVDRFCRAHDLPDRDALVRRAGDDPAWYWPAAFDFLGLAWLHPWHTALDLSRDAPFARWFAGGRTNAAWLCAERWATDAPNRSALVADDEAGARIELSFAELWDRVRGVAGGLRSLECGRGTTIAVYAPSCVESAVVFLAAAAIGAITVPIYSGYGVDAVAERLERSRAHVLVSVQGTRRGGRHIDMGTTAGEAVRRAGTPHHVVARGGTSPTPTGAVPYEALERATPIATSESMAADDPFLLVFTSGSSGAPKGVLHGHGGLPYQVPVELALNAELRPGDRLCWVSDPGWIVGAISLLGPLALGATSVVLEGHPGHPTADRLWRTVEDLGITHLGVSPTLVRTLSAGSDVDARPMPTLRALLSTGEPLDRPTWEWMHRYLGRGLRPVINVTGGTEVGGSILSGSIAVPMTAPGFAGPTPGMKPVVVDDEGRRVVGRAGELVIATPWPSRTLGLWEDEAGYLDTYWSRFPGMWRHGDRAVEHADGTWELLGRADDVFKVAGRRVGPEEYDSRAAAVPGVRMAAAVSLPDARAGERVVVAVVPQSTADGDLCRRVREELRDALGAGLAPSAVVALDELPLTASGKAHRRVLRAWLAGDGDIDIETVANPDIEEAVRAVGATLVSTEARR